MTTRLRSTPTTTAVFAIGLLANGALLSWNGAAVADEPHEPFLEALRQRTYYDTALEFLDDLETRTDLSDAEKRLIPYERAVTLQAQAKSSRNPDERVRLLERAEQLLSDFVANYAGDERIPDANGRLGRILLDRAESEILRANRPANADRADVLRQQARGYVEEARKVFTTARKEFEERYDSFPKFSNDDAVVAARDEAEFEKIQAWINLGLCTFTEARTYPEGDPQRERLLEGAAEEFRKIASEHRLQRVGLYATLWEGKCFEERGQLDVAISLYEKLLEVPEDEDPRDVSPATRALRDQALWFELGCWNEQGRHQLVYDNANEEDGWLKTAGLRANGFNGLGIQLELARAEEQLSKEKEIAASELDAKGMEREARATRDAAADQLRDALDRGREVARFSTPFQDGALELVNRIETSLEGTEGEPKDFRSAFNELRELVTKRIPAASRAVAKEEDPARKLDLEEARLDLLDDAERIGRLAVLYGREPGDEESATEDVHRAWYYLGYVKHQRDHYWDAAAVGTWLARSLVVEDPERARRGGELAVAAMEGEYRSGEPALREREFAQLVEAAELLQQNFPEDTETNRARMIVARIHAERGDPGEAATWYSAVTPSFAGHLEAQVKAGTAYWDAYLRAPQLPEDGRPDEATLDAWRLAAIENLERGIANAEKSIPEDAPDDQREPLILGKITLADILIADGREREAIDVLVEKPHSVVEAVEVEFGEERPATGPKSAAFASEAYKRLLRGHIGLGQTDEARQVMFMLEDVSLGSGLLELYEQLGQTLQAEIERLKDLGQGERLAQVRASFDGFLDKLYEGRNVLPYNTLLWIAESYYGIGTGMGDDLEADEYFSNAADVYRVIIDKAASDADFAPGISLDGVRLRLVSCLRRQGDYEDAEDLAMRVLASDPTRIDAQRAVASVLVNWAEAGAPDALEKYRRGLFGADVVHEGRQFRIRGWQSIVAVYRKALLAGQLEKDVAVRQLADASYEYAAGLRSKSLMETSPSARQKGLGAVRVEVEQTARQLGPYLDEEQRPRFQALYNRTQRDLNVPETSLAWAEAVAPRPPTPEPVAGERVANTKKEDAKTEEPVERSGGPGVLLVVFSVLLAAGAAAGCYVLMSKPRRRTPSYASVAGEPAFPSTGEGDATRRRRPAGAGTRKASASGEQSASPRKKRRRPTE